MTFHNLRVNSCTAQLVEIEPCLFVGTAEAANNADILKENGITHIINCSQTENVNESICNYLVVKMSDDMSGSLLPYIPILYTFIDSLIHPEPTGRDDQKLTPGKVLVHCRMGRSRSPAVIIAYLMKKYTYTYQKAFNYVYDKYPYLELNSFLEQELCEYERCNYNSFLAQQTILYRRVMNAEEYLVHHLYKEFHPLCCYFAQSSSSIQQQIAACKLLSKEYRCKECNTVLFYGVNVLYHIPQLSDCLLKEESTSLIGFNKKSSYSSPHMNIHSAINKMDSLSSCSQFTAESTTTNEFDLASDDSSSSESMGEDEQRKMIENVPFLQCPSFSPQKLGHLSISSTSTSETINELNSTVCPSPSISPDLDQLVIEEVKNSDEVHDVEENPSSLMRSLTQPASIFENIGAWTPDNDVESLDEDLNLTRTHSLRLPNPKYSIRYSNTSTSIDPIQPDMNMENTQLPLASALFLLKYGQYHLKPNYEDQEIKNALNEFCYQPSSKCNLYIEIPKWVQEQFQKFSELDSMEDHVEVYCQNSDCDNLIGVVIENEVCPCSYSVRNCIRIIPNSVY